MKTIGHVEREASEAPTTEANTIITPSPIILAIRNKRIGGGAMLAQQTRRTCLTASISRL